MRQPEPCTPIRVFLIEAHCGGLAALVELLQRTVERDIVYVGSAVGHSADLLERIRQARAAVVLVDLVPQSEPTAFVDSGFRKPTGLATISTLHSQEQATFKILAYSHGEHVRSKALEAGADAFLTKDALGAELRQMIRAVVAQDPALSPHV